MKTLILVVLVVAVVWYFFRKKDLAKKQNDNQTMLECDVCGIYVSSQDCLRYQEKHYCSIECMQKDKK